MVERITIIGAGHAAGQAALELRRLEHQGSITLLGAEPDPPYQRPPLSKEYLTGEMSWDRVLFRPERIWAEQAIDWQGGVTVTGIDRAGRAVQAEDGRHWPYDALIIATGASPRRLTLSGQPVPVLRDRADTEALGKALSEDQPVAVIGAGYIGLEVAAAARKKNRAVTVLEAAPRPLARVAGKALADWITGLHRRHGVEILTDAQTTGYEGGALGLADDRTVPAGTLLAGIGVTPNEALAARAGLACDSGIIVDTACRTEDAAIYAIGDCTRHPNALYDGLIRLESVHNAVEQAKIAAAAILGFSPHYQQVPWNWSNQYDARLRFAGLSQGHDEVILRGRPKDDKFAIFYLKEGRLIACDAVNLVPEFAAAQRLIAARAEPDPRLLADTDTPIRQIAATYLD